MRDVANILDVYFSGGTAPSAFYIGYVQSDNFTGFDPDGDTMASHAGWEEFTDYDEAGRPQWIPGTVVDGNPASVTNPTPGEVTPNAVKSIIAFFLVDDDTPGGTVGTLHGPWFLIEGPQTTVVGTPFQAEVTAVLNNDTSVVMP